MNRPRAIAALLALALAAGVIVSLWLFVSEEPPVGTAAAVGASARPRATTGSVETVDVPADLERVSTEVDLAVPGGIAIPAGVRLRGPGRLEGRVLERETGAALGAMRVDLHAVPPSGSGLIGRFLKLLDRGSPLATLGEPVATTGTDGSGNFVFDGVRVGTWYVEARGARHVPDSVARARVTSAGEGGPLDVWVRAGGRVVGIVLEPDGDPAPGALVTVSPGISAILESLRRGDLCFLETRTDEKGVFVVSGVPPGDAYDVHALRAGFAPSHVADVVVRVGEDTRVTLRTRNPGRIEGRVVSVGEAGKPPAPLAGAHLAAIPEGLRYLPFAKEILEQTHVVTDAEGRFTMRDVPPGDVDLVGIAPGHVGDLGPKLFVSEGALAVAPDFELPVGPTVSGRVVDAAGEPLAGVEVRWQPIDMERFGIDASFAPLVASAVSQVDFPRTGADGRFEAGAFPGEAPYKMDFRKSGYADLQHFWTPGSVSAEEGGEEGEEPEELEIVMGAGGFVEGIVMDVSRTEPLTSFTVTSEQMIAGDDVLGSLGPFGGGTLVEDAGGRFRIGPLEAGEVDLRFDAPGYQRTSLADLEVAAGETARGVIVEMYSGGVARGIVVNESGVPVPGTLVFTRVQGERVETAEDAPARGRQPSDDAPSGLLSYMTQFGAFADDTSRTGPDGRFELTGLEPGQHMLVGVHRDYAATGGEPFVIAPENGPTELELVLRVGGGIFGKVVDRFTRPIPSAIVIAVAPNNMQSEDAVRGAVYQGRTNETGDYEIENVDAGTYFMVLTRGDEALNPMSFMGSLNFDMVTVPEGERVEYDIVDSSVGATRVFGRVIARGEDVSHGQITAMGFESDSLLGIDVKVAPIREEGHYEFPGLAPGEYQLHIENAGAIGSVRMQIDVPDVTEYQLDLHVPEGRIAGRVVDASTGEAIANARITALSSDRPEPQGFLGNLIGRDAGMLNDWTDDDGTFVFERLQGADYEIGVRSAEVGEQRYAPTEALVISLGEDEDRDDVLIELQPALAVEGVVHGSEGAPVAEARVVAWQAGRPETMQGGATTDEEGRFRLEGLSPGTWTVSATHAEHAGGRTDVELSRDVSAEVELVLVPGVPVSVRVTGTNGRPVSGAHGRLEPVGEDAAPADVGQMMNSLFSGSGVSDAEGMLDLGRQVPGEYTLHVQRGFSRSEPETVTLQAGAPVRLRARLR
jgi:hypothetical protein